MVVSWQSQQKIFEYPDLFGSSKFRLSRSRLLEGRTAKVIAHRLATIRSADRIIVLQDGGIVETGPHDQLMESGGLYSLLYRMNYASFDDIPEEKIRGSSSDDGEPRDGAGG